MKILSLLAGLILVTPLLAQPLSKSSMRAHGCHELDRMVCKNEKSRLCEAVYVAKPDASPECKDQTLANIKQVCGTETALLFTNDKECIGAVPDESCPQQLNKISKSHIQNIYKCENLHLELCKSVCGPSYSGLDVRNFMQTGGKSGVVCIDGNSAPRTDCQEVHQGNSKWCISYNKIINKIDFGFYFQCAGKF